MADERTAPSKCSISIIRPMSGRLKIGYEKFKLNHNDDNLFI